LEALDRDLKASAAFARVDDPNAAVAYGLPATHLPGVILFDDGVPEIFAGSDVNDALEVRQWVSREIRSEDVEVLKPHVLRRVVRSSSSSLLAIFVENTNEDVPGKRKSVSRIVRSQPLRHLAGLNELSDLCDSLDVSIALVPGSQAATLYGIDRLPSVIYFEGGIPTVYEEDMDDVAALVEWIDEQRTSATIETGSNDTNIAFMIHVVTVTEEILEYLILAKEYLAVFFTGPCTEKAKTDQECKRVIGKNTLIMNHP